MKGCQLYKILLVLVFSTYSLHLMAEDTSCGGIYMSVSEMYNSLKYDISNNGTIEPAHVDSAQIVNSEGEVVQTYYVQSQEVIDISFLPRGYYVLWIYIGDCKYSRLFIARGTKTDLNMTEDNNSNVSKRIQNNQILIIRNEKTYTLTGQLIE